MIEALLGWLGAFWEALKYLWRESWRQFTKIFESVWGWGLIVVGWVYTCIKWVGDVLAEVASSIDAMVLPSISHGGPFLTGMNFVNSIIPLEELLSFIVAYAALRVMLILYRFVKSWLPTLSS